MNKTEEPNWTMEFTGRNLWWGLPPGRIPSSLNIRPSSAPSISLREKSSSAALKEKGRGLLLSEIEQISVISWILPTAEDTRKSNRKEEKFPSKLWAYTRDFGEACNNALRKHVVGFLEDLGYVAVAPTLLPTFQSFRDEKVGWASPWSERHIAYACGLGTFSLNDGLITPKGMAVRIGSVVTLLKLTPSEKKYRHYKENCLHLPK